MCYNVFLFIKEKFLMIYMDIKMKKVLLGAVIFVNSVHAMETIKPYDPEGPFKKIVRNGIGLAAVIGGSCYAYKKFQEGDLVG